MKMDLTIRTTANEIIQLQPGNQLLLPGSTAWAAKGDFGSISIEELNTGPFTIRYTNFSMLKKLTVYLGAESPAICTRIATKNNWKFSLGVSDDIDLNEGQFTLYRLNNAREKIIFEKGEEYRSFDTICHPARIDSLSKRFGKIVLLM